MKSLITLLILFTINASAQSHVKDLLLGHWSLKAVKSSPFCNQLSSTNNNHYLANNDSIINLIITKDSISVIKKRIYPKDTLTFKYELETIETSYGSVKHAIKLSLSKGQLKSFRKRYRKGFKSITLDIIKLNDNQLVIENFQLEPNFYHPLFKSITSTYSFIKNSKDNLKSKLCQSKGWFLESNQSNIFETDTILLKTDSLKANGLRHYHIIFNENHFEENLLKGTNITPQFGNAVFYSFSNKTWFINNHQIIILSNGQEFSYNYQFINNKLLLIKNGS